MKVKIKNFQSLKEVELDVQGLTTVTGTNNTGKSALTRAIYNSFSSARGSTFVRQGEDHCTVDIDFDGKGFVWEKGKKVNRYLVSGRKLDKVGSEVPTEVSDLGVRPVVVDGREVWPQFAKQFDQLFLLNQPPSTLASALSDVETIDRLDKALDQASRETRELTSKIKSKREDLHCEKERLKLFQDLPDIEVLIEDLSASQSNLDSISADLEKMSSMYKSLERITVISEILSESDVEIPDLKNITHLSDQISRAQDLKRTLAKESIREMMIEVGLESYPNIDDRYFKGIEKIKDKIKSLEDISHERKRYSGIDSLPTSVELPDIQTLTDVEKTLMSAVALTKLDVGMDQAQCQIEQITKDIEEIRTHFGDNCPLCGEGSH
jgi:DNA repair ATPase RecN